MSGNKQIAKNTIFLYFRLLFVMGVSLYASRVILQILGASDYGLYNVVGGIVAMLSFLNGAASAATSRYLTFNLGRNDKKGYQQTFSAAFFIHLGIAFVIFIFAETIGLWFLQNKLVIEESRMDAALWVFHLSVLTCFITFTQVPYNASLIAHEKMDIYAYVGIAEAVMKLLILYLLELSYYDKLKTYAFLVLAVSVSIAIFYRIYCSRKYAECKITLVKNKTLYKDLLKYTGWDTFGNLTGIAQTQGINIVLNLFLSTTVNAARGIAYQVDAAITNFITNFLTAVNPQITKSYAVGEYNRMVSLVFNSSKFSFLLFSCLAVPIMFCSDYILHIWLVNPPLYTVPFLQLVLANHFVSVMTQPLIIANHATKNVKNLNLISGTISVMKLPVAYILLFLGFNPIWVFVAIIPISFICLNVNIYLFKQRVELSVKDFYLNVIYSNIKMVIIPLLVCCGIALCIESSFARLVCITIVYNLLLLTILYKYGIDNKLKDKVRVIISKYKNSLYGKV